VTLVGFLSTLEGSLLHSAETKKKSVSQSTSVMKTWKIKKKIKKMG